jgi:hypothetical protein
LTQDANASRKSNSGQPGKGRSPEALSPALPFMRTETIFALSERRALDKSGTISRNGKLGTRAKWRGHS